MIRLARIIYHDAWPPEAGRERGCTCNDSGVIVIRRSHRGRDREPAYREAEKLPEGVYLTTSEEVPGLVAQGRTITETLEVARDVAKKLLEAQAERQGRAGLTAVGDSFDFPLIAGS